MSVLEFTTLALHDAKLLLSELLDVDVEGKSVLGCTVFAAMATELLNSLSLSKFEFFRIGFETRPLKFPEFRLLVSSIDRLDTNEDIVERLRFILDGAGADGGGIGMNGIGFSKRRCVL